MMWTWARQSPTRMMRCPAVIVQTAVTALALPPLPASHVSELLLVPAPTPLRALQPARGRHPFHDMRLCLENLTALIAGAKV